MITNEVTCAIHVNRTTYIKCGIFVINNHDGKMPTKKPTVLLRTSTPMHIKVTKDKSPMMKWVTRFALLAVFIAGCSWLDTIKVCCLPATRMYQLISHNSAVEVVRL